MNVHLLDPLTPEDQAALTSHLLPGIHITWGSELPADSYFQILVAGRPERKHLLASPDLQTIIIPWAGVPETTRQLMDEFPGLALHNLHHNAAPTAELALALLLAASKFILPFDQALRQGDWQARYQPSPAMLLAGKKSLILGFGEIGRRIARVCLALEMEVCAVRRHPEKQNPGLEQVKIYPPQDLHNLLGSCQVLIIALPLTPETEGLIGPDELDRLPHGSILVNIGRGPIVEQAALYRALVNGRLSAAGLDVWYNYPHTPEARLHTLPAEAPLHTLPNVVLSPHRGGDSRDTEALRMSHLAHLLNSAARGESLPNRVDLNLGY
jgi:phosphoglycerate dehydrogenase-like enzyme